MTEYVDRIRLRSDHEAEAIFPGATHQVSHMVFLPLTDIERAMRGEDFKTIAPVIYGCLNYKTPHVEGMRQTRFVYSVTSINDKGDAVVIRPNMSMIGLINQLYLLGLALWCRIDWEALQSESAS